MPAKTIQSLLKTDLSAATAFRLMAIYEYILDGKYPLAIEVAKELDIPESRRSDDAGTTELEKIVLRTIGQRIAAIDKQNEL